MAAASTCFCWRTLPPLLLKPANLPRTNRPTAVHSTTVVLQFNSTSSHQCAGCKPLAVLPPFYLPNLIASQIPHDLIEAMDVADCAASCARTLPVGRSSGGAAVFEFEGGHGQQCSRCGFVRGCGFRFDKRQVDYSDSSCRFSGRG